MSGIDLTSTDETTNLAFEMYGRRVASILGSTEDWDGAADYLDAIADASVMSGLPHVGATENLIAYKRLAAEVGVDFEQSIGDVWFRLYKDDEAAEYEANTFFDGERYRIEWYHNAVGLVTNEYFDTLEQAHDWYEDNGYEDYSS